MSGYTSRVRDMLDRGQRITAGDMRDLLEYAEQSDRDYHDLVRLRWNPWVYYCLGIITGSSLVATLWQVAT